MSLLSNTMNETEDPKRIVLQHYIFIYYSMARQLSNIIELIYNTALS